MGASVQEIDIHQVEATALGFVRVLIGSAVYSQLENLSFQSAWDKLYAGCSWGTVFQSRAFVDTWYRVYKERQEPILIVAEHKGRLTGLVALTKENGSKLITGAGVNEAGYHVWLSENDFGDLFITEALHELTSKFPQYKLLFKHIPPQAPLAWVEHDQELEKRCVLRTFSRPLMDFKTPDLIIQFNKKSYRSKVAKLRKLGNMRFERIIDREHFASVLDELNRQFDFRKAATLNITPFRSEPLKKDLQLALFDQGLLYVTVLLVNETLVAANIDTIGKGNWVFGVGINAHNPTFGKYSPGIVSFLLLGQRLFEEGVEVYDLTTGGHSYKEGLVNAHDQVYELSIGGPNYRVKAVAKEKLLIAVKQRLRKLGVEPYELRARWMQLREQLKLLNGAGGVQLLYAALFKPKVKCYTLQHQLSDQLENITINCLDDLLCFKQKGGALTRWDFSKEAERRLQAGEQVFSLSENGVLLCCAWLSATSGAAVISGVYYHHSGLAVVVPFLVSVARSVGPHAVVAAEDTRLQRMLEGAGFKVV